MGIDQKPTISIRIKILTEYIIYKKDIETYRNIKYKGNNIMKELEEYFCDSRVIYRF